MASMRFRINFMPYLCVTTKNHLIAQIMVRQEINLDEGLAKRLCTSKFYKPQLGRNAEGLVIGFGFVFSSTFALILFKESK